MPRPSSDDWRVAQARSQLDLDRELLRTLRQSYRDLGVQIRALEDLPGTGSAIRSDQLRIVRAALHREIDDVATRTGEVVSRQRLRSASRAASLSGALDEAIFRSAGSPALGAALRRSLQVGLERTVNVAMARLSGASHRPLSARVYGLNSLLNGRLDRVINSALARGLSARELAGEVRGFVSPYTPGGVRYAAMRLARTEINNAFHAMAVDSAMDAPWVEGMKWHLSGSHPEPDECDELASGGRNGDGVYTPDEIPGKPHPNCFCYTTPEPMPMEQFTAALRAGRFDSYIRGRVGAG